MHVFSSGKTAALGAVAWPGAPRQTWIEPVTYACANTAYQSRRFLIVLQIRASGGHSKTYPQTRWPRQEHE
ncbi:hypothetical protein AYM40_24530 [Paraburkholderia phytofirmans OLGA172]|uniref:Uncharacterized protein n=1 Tax=Paraburkholderia phytofirmans OLGA172 TaxID=1417228 RepID=A0A167WBK3_9BURK|nr:hypothetical protein AYM40_24530 [Paraburkholderia phytofirmans OLGA172]